MNKTEIPDWMTYPQEKWVQIIPAQAGFDAVKFNSIVVKVRGGREKFTRRKNGGQSLPGAVTWCGSGGIQPTNTKRRLLAKRLVAYWLGSLWRQA